ncbi:MAG: hypothetical protein NZL88_11760, partial [Gaiellaceae bacterium]|nr:hypothetical protein [Gaiellaceae bacterium]
MGAEPRGFPSELVELAAREQRLKLLPLAERCFVTRELLATSCLPGAEHLRSDVGIVRCVSELASEIEQRLLCLEPHPNLLLGSLTGGEARLELPPPSSGRSLLAALP